MASVLSELTTTVQSISPAGVAAAEALELRLINLAGLRDKQANRADLWLVSNFFCACAVALTILYMTAAHGLTLGEIYSGVNIIFLGAELGLIFVLVHFWSKKRAQGITKEIAQEKYYITHTIPKKVGDAAFVEGLKLLAIFRPHLMAGKTFLALWQPDTAETAKS